LGLLILSALKSVKDAGVTKKVRTVLFAWSNNLGSPRRIGFLRDSVSGWLVLKIFWTIAVFVFGDVREEFLQIKSFHLSPNIFFVNVVLIDGQIFNQGLLHKS
jgi:hypothetical protein